MRLGLRVAPNAETEIRQAAAWWHANRPAAPELFREELTRAFEVITTQPGVGQRVGDDDLGDVRRVLLYRIR